MLRQNYSRLQEKLKITQSQLESVTQEKRNYKIPIIFCLKVIKPYRGDNMKLKSLNETSLKLLFQNCQNEEQLVIFEP